MPATAKPLPDDKSDSPVPAAARAALEIAKGDVHAAAKELGRAAQRNPALKSALLTPYLEAACLASVGMELRQGRKRLWQNNASINASTEDERRASITRIAAANLLMFPLPGGQFLANATRDDVTAASAFYHRQADDMAWKGRWLAAVADKLGNNKTVRDVLTHDALNLLQQAARDPA